MSKKRSTNAEKVADFMNFSENGAMSQLLVMEGIARYATELDKLTDEQVKELDGRGSLINMGALQRTAREWLTKYDSK